MATPIEKPSRLTTATREARYRFKNFSRRFESKPKPVNIATLPPALGTRGGDVLEEHQYQSNAETSHFTHSQANGQTNERTSVSANGLTNGRPNTSVHGNSKKDEGFAEHHEPNPTRNSTSTTSTSPAPNIRPPLRHRRFSRIFASARDFKLPDLPWLCGTWHVTHTSVPVWREKRNVRVTYTRLPGNKLQDVTAYEGLHDASGRVDRIRGVDRLNRDGSYAWTGHGKLTVGGLASSRWEVLGWGGGGSKAAVEADPERNEQWLITFFAKTVFTPAGVSICSRRRRGLTERTLKKLMKGTAQFRLLALFIVKDLTDFCDDRTEEGRRRADGAEARREARRWQG